MKKIIGGTLFVTVLNLLLNFWIVRFSSFIPTSPNYFMVHHYYPDDRSVNEKLNPIRAWGQTDSQWYLKIASEGYGRSLDLNIGNKKNMEGLSYAFFPMLPLLIRFVAQLTNKDYELAAFLLSNLLMLINWVSIYYVTAKIFSKKIAFIVPTLMLLFPFSLFLRSYHAEGLYLLGLTWFLYFLSKRKFLQTSLFLALLNITKGTGWLLNLIYLYYLFKSYKKGKVSLSRTFLLLLIPAFPVILWVLYVHDTTGNPLFFIKAVNQWTVPGLSPALYNIYAIGLLGRYVVEGSWLNVFQTVIFIFSVWILARSYDKLHPVWWWASFLLLIVPTVTTYSVGYTSGRLAVIQLPLWIYFVSTLGNRGKMILALFFTVFLFLGSLYFVNWHWWG